MSGVLTPPDRAHGIALERCSQLARMLCRESGKGHCQVKAQRHIPASVVGEPVHQLVRLIAPLAQQDFGIFEGGCVDRQEAITTKGDPGCLQQVLTGDH